jgi:ATP:ADP antiporter, AAA family
MFKSFSSSEKWFIFFVMFANLLISAEYSITRPASNSLFLALFSSKALPWVWLVTLPLNFALVGFYNRFLGTLGPLKMWGVISCLIVCVNGMTGLLLPIAPWLIFLQFAWKDIYILLMFKQLWSLIHSTIESGRAKYLYGVIFGMGTVGSIVGGLVPGLFAVKIGSSQLFFLTLPLYFTIFWLYRKAFGQSRVGIEPFVVSKEPLSSLFKSPLLISVLLLVVFMQVSVGLMEFQFNASLEQEITNPDLRTEYMGQLLSIMNVLSGVFQLVGSFVMVQALGVRGSHLVVPLLLLVNVVGMLTFPSFAILTAGFVFLKAVDFSLFGVIREMLYIPMQLDERFRAKAVIDVFAYRTAKALVALSIFGLQIFAGTQLHSWVNGAMLGVLVFWLGVVWFMLRRHYPQTT